MGVRGRTALAAGFGKRDQGNGPVRQAQPAVVQYTRSSTQSLWQCLCRNLQAMIALLRLLQLNLGRGDLA